MAKAQYQHVVLLEEIAELANESLTKSLDLQALLSMGGAVEFSNGESLSRKHSLAATIVVYHHVILRLVAIQNEVVMSRGLEELNLPTRVVFSLHRAGIKTFGQLLKRGREVFRLRGIGAKGYKVIETSLNKHGLSLAGNVTYKGGMDV